MTKKADEIRASTAKGVLHALVADGLASPRGLCMESIRSVKGLAFCIRDYGHCGRHYNFAARIKWNKR
jgi:hypothetical protein